MNISILKYKRPDSEVQLALISGVACLTSVCCCSTFSAGTVCSPSFSLFRLRLSVQLRDLIIINANQKEMRSQFAPGSV